VAQNTNYLAANFVTVTNPGDKEVKMLLPLKEQLIELKLGSSRITDSALQVIAQFKNLMRLQLDYTKITDTGTGKFDSIGKISGILISRHCSDRKGCFTIEGSEKPPFHLSLSNRGRKDHSGVI
jgi:hypothetical protein